MPVRKSAASPPATPQATPQWMSFPELGISGVTRWGAISRVYEEFLRELQGPQGMKNFREMIDNSPIVGGILFAAYNLGRHVTFRFDAKDSSPEAKRVAEFVKSAVFDDMDATWPDNMTEILSMLPFGWALLEMVFKKRQGPAPFSAETQQMLAGIVPPPQTGTGWNAQPRVDPLSGRPEQQANGSAPPAPAEFVASRFNDGLIGFKKWGLRGQETLYMWEWNDADSSPKVMQQMAPPDYRIRRIPLVKSLLFRTQISKNNPEGRSILRNAWTSYYFSRNIQVFEGIGVERDLAGYPVMQVVKPDLQNPAVPDIWNPKDPDGVAMLARITDIVRKVRRDDQEGMVLPWWLDFKLVSTGSRRQFDTNAIVTRYEQRIAMSVIADFILVGHDSTGSKALASTKTSLFSQALASYIDNLCAVVNRFAVPMLLEVNGIPTALAPTLTHGDIETIDLADLANYILNLSRAGMSLFPDHDLEEALREAGKLPASGVAPDPEEADTLETAGLEEGTGGEAEAEAAQPGEDPRPTPAPSGPFGKRAAARRAVALAAAAAAIRTAKRGHRPRGRR